MRRLNLNLHAMLTSENALVLSLVATLALMGRHVYHVYHAGTWGYIAAIGLAVATMQFILRGHKIRGYLFAGLDMAYNLAFFGLLTPILEAFGAPALFASRAPDLLLSIAIPVVLACYAHDYASKVTRQVDAPVAEPEAARHDQPRKQPKQQRPVLVEQPAPLAPWLQEQPQVAVAAVVVQEQEQPPVRAVLTQSTDAEFPKHCVCGFLLKSKKSENAHSWKCPAKQQSPAPMPAFAAAD